LTKDFLHHFLNLLQTDLEIRLEATQHLRQMMPMIGALRIAAILVIKEPLKKMLQSNVIHGGIPVEIQEIAVKMSKNWKRKRRNEC